MAAPWADVEGQPVVEGVVVRSSTAVAVAVRRATGEVVVRQRPRAAWAEQAAGGGLLGALVGASEALHLALTGLLFATAQLGRGGPLAPAAIAGSGLRRATLRRRGAAQAAGYALAAALVTLLAVLGPPPLAAWLGRQTGAWGAGGAGRALLALLCRVGGLALALLALRRLPESRRLLQYSAATALALHAAREGLPAELRQLRALAQRAPLPARPGPWAWAAVLCILALGAGALLGGPAPGGGWGGLGRALARAAAAALPAMVLGFALCRSAAGTSRRPWARALRAPAAWLTRLTQVRPPDAMLEVALAAWLSSRARGQPLRVVAPTVATPLVAQNFADVCARRG